MASDAVAARRMPDHPVIRRDVRAPADRDRAVPPGILGCPAPVPARRPSAPALHRRHRRKIGSSHALPPRLFTVGVLRCQRNAFVQQPGIHVFSRAAISDCPTTCNAKTGVIA